MKDYEIDIKEIKDILKKMQEDINRLENNYLVKYEYCPTANNLHSTQACSEEELLRQLKFS